MGRRTWRQRNRRRNSSDRCDGSATAAFRLSTLDLELDAAYRVGSIIEDRSDGALDAESDETEALRPARVVLLRDIHVC